MVLAVLAGVAACGDSSDERQSDSSTLPEPTSSEPSKPPVDPAGVVLPDRVAASASPTLAGAAVAEFGHDLLKAVSAGAEPGQNVVVSPLSVAVAFGMLEPGVSGEGTEQLRALLRIDDPAAWHASMSALEQGLESRQPNPVDDTFGEDQDPGELTVAVANAAFLRPGYPFLAAYLEQIGTTYGAVLEELDFSDPVEAAARINAFIADATDDHITDLVPPEAIDPDTTQMALVNALLLYASWFTTFDSERTVDGDFTRLDGTVVAVPLMHGSTDQAIRGDGFVAGSKSLIGDLAVEFVLPDDGRFDEIAGDLGAAFAALGDATHGAELVMPRFEIRVRTDLQEPLEALGLMSVFTEGHLLGVSDDPTAKVDAALHEAWLSVDEDGIEAAAATVILMVATSGPAEQPPPVVLDRPFLFRIVDRASGATMFEGRIVDPTT